MALSIENSEADRLAREVAKETGESITSAIESALRERLRQFRQKRNLHARDERIRETLSQAASTACPAAIISRLTRF